MTALYTRLRDRYWRWQAWRHWWGLDGWLQLIRDSFPGDYIVKGNKGEQTMQAGNAVSVNAAHWIGTRILEAIA